MWPFLCASLVRVYWCCVGHTPDPSQEGKCFFVCPVFIYSFIVFFQFILKLLNNSPLLRGVRGVSFWEILNYEAEDYFL